VAPARCTRFEHVLPALSADPAWFRFGVEYDRSRWVYHAGGPSYWREWPAYVEDLLAADDAWHIVILMPSYLVAPNGGWQSTKIGPGPNPIETSEGWLLFYHGVLTSCNGFVYSFGAALLDLDEPWKVICRSRAYLLSPQRDYECVGDVPNVVFPCATLYDSPSGRIALYYGGADTVTALAFTYLDEVINFIKASSK
jgi:predicted GH43/DUF377 family glycosyl hydrolase